MANPMSLVLIGCLSVTAVLATPLLEKRRQRSAHYGILLDAGSSSTKLKIYTWTPPKTQNGVPNITPVSVDNNRFKPGLASYEGDLPGMTSYMTDILEEAKQHIDQRKWARTPIYLLATAGFRLLGLDDAQTGMAEVESILSNSSINPFLYKKDGASVLSGEEEGVYAWLAANYLLGFFDSDKPQQEAVGVLEMGGGSTQIVFIPRQPLMAEEFQVTMGGKRYSLYVQSYLKFGSLEVKEKVAQALLEMGNPGQTSVGNPCMLAGDTQDMTLDDGTNVSMTGTGQPLACREIYKQLLASAPPQECNLEPCAIGSVFQPSVEGIDFYATQAYTYPMKGVGAVDSDNTQLDLSTLWDKTKAYCETPISAIPEDKRKWASSDCSGAVYIDTLLTGPYGFSRNTQHIQVTSKIEGDDIDWALGAMLEFLSLTFTNNPQHVSVKRK